MGGTPKRCCETIGGGENPFHVICFHVVHLDSSTREINKNMTIIAAPTNVNLLRNGSRTLQNTDLVHP